MRFSQKKIRFLLQPVTYGIRIVFISMFVLLFAITVSGKDNPAPTSDSSLSEDLTPEKLGSQNAKIGKILIENQNVFDLNNPLEDRWLYRIANTLHIRTRPKVIRRQLLFKEGEAYSAGDIKESARILRANGLYRRRQN